MRRIGLDVPCGRGGGVAAVALAVLVAVAGLLGQLGRPLTHAATPAVVAGAPAPAVPVPGIATARTARDTLPGAADGPAPEAVALPAPAAVAPGPVEERTALRPGWPGPRSGTLMFPILAMFAATVLLPGPMLRGVASAVVAAHPHPFRGGARPGRAPPVGC